MTGIIGFRFPNGVFIAADTRRTFGGSPNRDIPFTKVHKITPKIGLASCGTPIEAATNDVIWSAENQDADDIIKLIQSKYSEIMNMNHDVKEDILTTLILFGLNKNDTPFMYKLEWNKVNNCFTIVEKLEDETGVMADGSETGVGHFKTMGENNLELVKVQDGFYLEQWAVITMKQIIDEYLPQKHEKMKDVESLMDVVGFPIDLIMIKKDENMYKRIEESKLTKDDVTEEIQNVNDGLEKFGEEFRLEDGPYEGKFYVKV
ncbi:hypothetical protein [Bacillus toyonensis]|uniref:hypothetical protein n=1 Tax=Bacillus toyonensis TaxID=155322 RepID=UPI00259EAEAD|nr:hypothetical protein [Bacillus toyonensis]MDM5257050.1 hypothetical protein [Bacillus toyonensis]